MDRDGDPMSAAPNGHADVYATAAEVRALKDEWWAEAQARRQEIGKILVESGKIHLLQLELKVSDQDLSGRIGNMSAAVFEQKAEIQAIQDEQARQGAEQRRQGQILDQLAIRFAVKL